MENNIKKRMSTVMVKGEKITFEEFYLVDDKTGEEIFNRDLEIKNDTMLFDAYKETQFLLTSDKIKCIRNKYGMNQKDYALILGLGEITVHRFENGSIQSDAIDTIMKLSDNPDNMYDFFKKNKNYLDNNNVYYEKIIELKNLKKHEIAEFNRGHLEKLIMEESDAISVSNKIIKVYNNKIDKLSKEYNINDSLWEAEYITPLKLQKLLYYVQGLSLNIFNSCAFTNDILAWKYGPVVKEVYDKHKTKNPISYRKEKSDVCDAINEIVQIVVNSYGNLEAESLINLTHEEDPWINTDINNVIEIDRIKLYFDKVYNKL